MDDTKANYNPLSQIVVPPVSKKHTAKEIIVLNQTFSNLLQELHEQTERRVEYEKKDAATPYRDDFISGKASFPL